MIELFSGGSNVFADVLTRWWRGYSPEQNRQAVRSLILESAQQIIPSANSFQWPNVQSIREAQGEIVSTEQGTVWDSDDNL